MFDRVTVLMPTYKHEKYLPEAIESVLNQSFEDFEFIILSDGSPDNSKNIIKKYASKDHRIVPCIHEFNMGRGWCRNILIVMAQTDLCAWMDSDDIMHTDRLKKQVAYMKDDVTCKFLATEMNSLMPDGSIVAGICTAKDYEHIGSPGKSLREWNCIANPTVMFYKKILVDAGGYNSELKEMEDIDLWERLYSEGHQVKCLPERLHTYRIGTHSK